MATPEAASMEAEAQAELGGVAAPEPSATTRGSSQMGLSEASLADVLDVESVAQETILAVREMLDADGASVLLLDKVTGELRFAGISGGNEALSAKALAKGEGIVGWVATHNASISIADVHSDDRFSHRFDEGFGYETQTVVAAPLRLGDELIGVIEGVNRPARPFNEEDEKTLMRMGRHVSIAFANARLAEALRDRNAALEAEIQSRFRQIIDAKEEWLQTVDGIPDRILMIEANYKIRRGNIAVARAAKCLPTDIPGKVCYELLFNRDCACEGCPASRAFLGETVRSELQIGEQFMELSHFPIRPRDAGDVTTIVCSYRDVTEQRALASRLQASQRLASVGRLAGGMAHEINNPIGFVSSNLSSLNGILEELEEISQELSQAGGDGARESSLKDAADTALQKQQAEHLESLHALRVEGEEIIADCQSGARRITQIVKELGTFAVDDRAFAAPIRLGDIVDFAMAQLQAEFDDARLALRGDRGLWVKGVSAQLARVVYALVRNALQASPDRRVSITLAEKGVQASIIVDDNGPGIPLDRRNKVFDPFFTTRRVGENKGLGLGLSVAYAIADSMGGRISIEDAPTGGGARVSVHLPLCVQESEDRRQESEPEAAQRHSSRGGPLGD